MTVTGRAGDLPAFPEAQNYRIERRRVDLRRPDPLSYALMRPLTECCEREAATVARRTTGMKEASEVPACRRYRAGRTLARRRVGTVSAGLISRQCATITMSWAFRPMRALLKSSARIGSWRGGITRIFPATTAEALFWKCPVRTRSCAIRTGADRTIRAWLAAVGRSGLPTRSPSTFPPSAASSIGCGTRFLETPAKPFSLPKSW